MSGDNVVYLKHYNPEMTESQAIDFMVCKHCKNKTFTLTYDSGSGFPMVKCAACVSHLGRMGWALDEDHPKL